MFGCEQKFYDLTVSITYNNNLPDESEFFDLFETTGWNHKYKLSSSELRTALEKSWYCLSAYENEKLVIPLNMRDGTILAVGKSNANWNFSAPHGAGRVDSRRWANENLSNKEAQKRMNDKDIYYSTLPTDETRDAYKDAQMIKDSLDPTATLLDHIIPVLVMKDGSKYGSKHKRKKSKK